MRRTEIHLSERSKRFWQVCSGSRVRSLKLTKSGLQAPPIQDCAKAPSAALK
jgi:hypothetical protein